MTDATRRRVMQARYGLMGLDNDGRTLYRPDGRRLFALPRWLARLVQRVQHSIAVRRHG